MSLGGLAIALGLMVVGAPFAVLVAGLLGCDQTEWEELEEVLAKLGSEF